MKYTFCYIVILYSDIRHDLFQYILDINEDVLLLNDNNKIEFYFIKPRRMFLFIQNHK